MHRSRAVAVIVASVLLAAACTGADPGDAGRGPDEPAVEPAVELAGSLTADEAAEAAAAVNAFGFDLHRGVAERGGNTVTSPLSASVLLAMVAAGAGGVTADEMIEVLRLDDTRDRRYAALLADLTADSDVTLSIANALWAADGYPFEDDYLTFARDTFGATLDEVDLGSQAAADDIDAWVADRTEGLIEEIAEDLGLPDPTAVLVLVNAVYFLGGWSTQFDPDDTRDEAFHLADGTIVDVPTMHRSEDTADLQLAYHDDHQVVRLPYGDDERFGMEVFVPAEGADLDAWLADFDDEAWRSSVDELAPAGQASLALPRFELEWDAELSDVLAGLGMPSAFGGGDFTPMSPADPFLDTVVQKTYIRVDEEGTEAAAVTGGVMAESGPVPFVVDRPFLFTVSDRDTGTILFLGTVHDPRGDAAG